MTRWIMIALVVIGTVFAFVTKSPGVLGFSLLLVLIGLFGVVMSIAADRVSSNTRPETAMLQPEVLAAIRERAKAQAANSAPQNGASTPARRHPAA